MKSVLCLMLCSLAAYAQSAARAEELWRAHNYDAANIAFRDLVAANPGNANLKVRWGRLLLDRFNRAEAQTLFQEALTLDKSNAGAKLGMALVAEESYSGSAADLARDALKSDPKLVEAQELLAKLALEDNDPKTAREEADRAFKLNGQSLGAEAVDASADLLEHRPADKWLTRIAAEHPRDGSAYETIGHFMEINRRYEDAIDYFHKALTAEPDLWSARSQLGLNLMRLGREEEARKELELCYANRYRNDATVNTLRLMDSYKRFETFPSKTTVLKLDKKEAPVLRLYMEPEFQRAIATYRKKYEFTLPRQVQLEVYPDHPDFEVRTTGMPGIGGILGVTFQDVVAMDSPSARAPGEFHWAATMWHELSHVYVLSMTKQRVPRWFTEGVAVHEESQAAPDWGDRLTPDAIKAIKEKKLLPVAELDRGFIHPKYPGQVVISYFQAGKICDYIAKQWGEHKLLDMIRAYANTDSTVEVIQQQLGMKPEEFDTKFLAALDAETKHDVDHFSDWQKGMKELHAALTAKHYDEVIAKGPAVRDLYPEFVEHGSAYEALADAYRAKGEDAKAAAELSRYSRAGGRDPRLLLDLSSMSGDKAESIHVLERLLYIAPLDESLHQKLGERYLAVSNGSGAAREYRALIAGKASDQAGAHFGLAQALRLEHKDAAAKDELLESLEAAPGFKPAQKMLLEMNGNSPSD